MTRCQNCAVLLAVLAAPALAAEPPDLRRDGAFGFPQARATVLCDSDMLRVSAACDGEHLYVQAILFTDGDAALGETSDGREIGDWSALVMDVDADGKATADVDRNYSLSPWPTAPGLHYQIVFDDLGSSGINADSRGRGSISYVDAGEGRKIRVDSFLIPIAEIGRKPGDTIRFAYWGSSPTPALTVNSIGFTSPKRYYSHSLPRKDWHSFELKPGAPIDVQAVPEGRGTIAVPATKPMPEVGVEPPEVVAADWINWTKTEPPSLKALRGQVVAVEFWATWCGPCVAGIPHLNELHASLGSRGLVILSLTDQKKPHVADFMGKTPMNYVVGTGSKAGDEYGVTGIPHAFIVGRDGKVVWHGHPADEDFEKHLKSALAAK